MNPHIHLTVAIAGIALFAAACGGDASTADVDRDARTVEIDMVDIAFEPGGLEVNEGETVRFVFTNRGDVTHDAFIGDADAQADHAADMRAAGGDEHGGHDDHGDDDDHGGHGADEESAITVEPGETAALTYTFRESGTVEVGCHQPGHYEAGMKITVEVA